MNSQRTASSGLGPTALISCIIALCAACDSGEAVNTIGVNVRGSVSVVPTTFSGHYVYLDSDGARVRRNLDGSGNFNEVVQGRRVVLATLRRTSSTGVIGLVITSNGRIVYDSGILQTNDLIFYEAP